MIIVILISLCLVSLTILGLILYKMSVKDVKPQSDVIVKIDINNFQIQKDSLYLAAIAYTNSLKIKTLLTTDCAVMIDTYKKIQSSINNKWEIVWGPAIGRIGTAILAVYDNMMYIVKDKINQNNYKIVIRGTNPIALTSWIYQNPPFKLINWDSNVDHGQISEGTYNAFLGKTINDGILFIKPCNGVPGYGLVLTDYLKKIPSNSNISIVGHSLGGLLSTTLHLYLENKKALWSKSNIYLTSISFGAPTAGNNLFADYSNKVLGNNFIRVVNTMDIANYAWSNLLSVKSLYKYMIDSIPINYFIDKLYNSVYTKFYTQLNNKRVFSFKAGQKTLLVEFFSQAIYQHLQAYLNYYSINEMDILIFLK